MTLVLHKKPFSYGKFCIHPMLMRQNMVNEETAHYGECRVHRVRQGKVVPVCRLPAGRVLLQCGNVVVVGARTMLCRNVGREPRAGPCVRWIPAGPFLVKGRPQWQQDDRPAERRQADDADHCRTSRKRSLAVWLGLECSIG